MKETLNLKLQGLFTSPNNLSAVPQGALEIAENVVIDKANIVESRKGQKQYGSALTVSSDAVQKLFNYSTNTLANYNNKLAYDSDGLGTFVDYTGSYAQPAADYKMRSLEANKNFYFTTTAGIYKLDSITSTPIKAGVSRALGGSAVLNAVTGFLVANSSVAYRIVWGYTDLNGNLVLGAPSQRVIVQNATVDSYNVNVSFLIPDDVTTSYFYQIYRSLGTLTSTDTPSDELQLVAQASPTAGEITAKTFTITDITPYSLMRATLYTSPSQQGILNSNLQPPLAMDMAIFKNCALYANTTQKHNKILTMIGADFPSISYYVDASVGTTSGLPTLTTIASTADLRVGMRCVGTGIPTNTTILTIDSANQVTMTANATATASVSVEFQDRFTANSINYWAGSSNSVSTNTFLLYKASTPAINIDQSTINLVNLINTSTSNTTLYAYYLSGLDDLPGQFQLENRSLATSSFAITSTAGSSFSPVLPTSGTTVSSTNETNTNRIFISKTGQVESVPALRYFDVGSANFPIKRIIALRDGVFIFKQDGIFRLSGETFESFTVALIDNTTSLLVPESAVAFNNQVFCFGDQGIIAVSDSGVQILSVPIEDQVLKLSSDNYSNFVDLSFAVGYESSRQYIFFTVTEANDTYCTKAFVYNSLTSSFTTWIMDRTCGFIKNSDDKLYMAKPSGQVMVERKSFTNDDYADEEFAVTISSVVSNTSIVLSSITNVSIGMTLGQGGRTAYISDISGTTLTIVSTSGFLAGAATVYTPITNRIQWAPIDVENPGILKQFSECSFFFRNAAFLSIDAGFKNNIYNIEDTVSIENKAGIGWGNSPWGDQPWGSVLGGQVILRTYVPRSQQRASWIQLSLQTEEAFTGFSLQGLAIMYNTMSSRQR